MPETKTQLCPTHFQSYKQRAPILLYCILCSSIALVSEARTALTPLKPLSYKLSNEIDFKNLNKLFGYIGYCIFFSINVNDTMINKTDKQKIFKHLLKSILFYDIDNLLTLLKKQDIKDYIIDYLN